VLVCDPRRNALLKEGNKSDKIDARKLADLLRTGMLRPVYHGEHGLRTLRKLGRSYQTISQDLNRVMNRIKARYRGWSILVRVPRSMLRVIGKSGYRLRWWPSCIPSRRTSFSGSGPIARLLMSVIPGMYSITRSQRPAASQSRGWWRCSDG
jgi:hypothetical protein